MSYIATQLRSLACSAFPDKCARRAGRDVKGEVLDDVVIPVVIEGDVGEIDISGFLQQGHPLCHHRFGLLVACLEELFDPRCWSQPLDDVQRIVDKAVGVTIATALTP